MKQDNHLLDDFLRGRVEEADVSYKEEYWKKMSGILEEDEKKKKRPFFWRGLSMLAILLAVGIGAYLLPKLNHSNEDAAKPSGKEVVTTQKGLLPSAVQDQPVFPNLPNENKTSSKITPSSIITTTTHPSSVSSSIPANHSSASVQNNKKSTVATHSTATNESAVTTNALVSKSSSTSDISSTTSTVAEGVSIPAKSITKKATKEKTSLADGSVANLLRTEKRTKKANRKNKITVPITDPKTDQTTAKRAAAESMAIETILNSSATVNVQGRKMQALDTTHYVTRPARDESIYNPRYISSLSKYIPERLDSITVITYKPVAEIVQPIINSNSEKTSVKIRHPFEVILFAGLNANKGFSGNVTDPLSWALSPYVSGGIEKQFTSKLSMATHVGFTYFNALNTEMKSTSYQYGFGLDSSSFTIAHKKLLELYLPVSVYYEVLKNHYLMASLGVSYGVDVSSKVTETSLSNNTGFPSYNSKAATTMTTMESGYRSGFNQFDMFAQIGYSYKLVNSLMIQCVFQQGFFDITKNDYFKNSLNNTQTRISIGLKYNFKRN